MDVNMNAPRIAIPTPTSTDLPYNQRSWPSYASCVERSGGEPVRFELGLSRAEALALAETCCGVCLPGSPADVEPALYGEERDEACAAADERRYRTDELLLEHATRLGKPVLAICYGLQSLNVWRGGSMVQDLLPMPVNHAAGSKVAIAHSAAVARESFLASLMEPSEAAPDREFLRVPVNSSHHQAVASPGTGLRIVARCPDDGVIEALEDDAVLRDGDAGSGFLLGVQWHPERSYDLSATSRALFDRLVTEARKFGVGSAAPVAERA
jgi:putative glutamine amidotransferase